MQSKSKTFKRVLVVEDDPNLLDELRDLFEAEFETVMLATDGGEAYVHTVSEEFDLIFTDQKMPGMSGLELITRLRSEGKQTPVILSSSAAEREDLVKAMRLGINDFVEKPYTPDGLKQTLYRNLEMIRRQRRLVESQVEHGINSPPAQQNRRMLGLLQAVHSSFKKVIG
jgi:DNA-binding response OmpR family regulator